jgi:hypothetical protein
MRLAWRACLVSVFLCGAPLCAAAQTAHVSMTWPEIRDRFQATNPTLQAGWLAVDKRRPRRRRRTCVPIHCFR